MRALYSYRAMRNPVAIRKTIDIPVPGGKEREAEEFMLQFPGRRKS